MYNINSIEKMRENFWGKMRRIKINRNCFQSFFAKILVRVIGL